MISPCRCSDMARLQVATMMDAGKSVDQVEVEFREVPYFVVSRSREKWNPERGDINAIDLVMVIEQGLVFDADGNGRRSIVPWQNVISITARTEEK